MQYTIFKQGTQIDFQSELTDNQALSSLSVLNDVKNSQFAFDLLSKNNLSPKQMAWVHWLVKEWSGKETPITTINVDKIYAFLYQPIKLKRPKIHVKEYTFSKPSETSKIRGYVAVTIDGQYFGKVNEKGEFFGNSNIKEYSETINNINENILQSIKEHAKHSGHCCLCERELTTDDSVHNGYGKTCAKHYGLPYESVNKVNKL